jgi:hypothetical protein
MMQKAAMVRESIAATIFLAQGVGSNLGYYTRPGKLKA